MDHTSGDPSEKLTDMNTVDTVHRIFVEYFELDPGSVDANTDLTRLGLDSISVMEFVFKVEDEFKVQLPDFSAADNTVPLTLGTMADIVNTLLGNQRSPST
jgi:acyl carrier protein